MSTGGIVRVAFAGQLGAFHLDVAFDVPASGVTALFGPSGCGKTTVLRCLAGLQRLPHGLCAIDGEVWQSGALFQPAHRRQVGYVFQEASLFPHLSVRRNLLFGAPGSAAPENTPRSSSTRSPGCSASAHCSSDRPATCPAASGSGSPSAAPCCRSPSCC